MKLFVEHNRLKARFPCVKNTCLNTLEAIKTVTGITSAASRYTGNNAKTINQLGSDNSNTVQLNNNFLQYGETPQL